MKTYRNKVTGEYHTRLSDGTLSRGYASREELQQVIRRLQRNAAQRERYAAMKDCGLTKTPYGWE